MPLHRDELYVGVDIGGSAIKAGVVTHDGTVLSRCQCPLIAAEGRDAALDTIDRQIQALLKKANATLAEISGIGIGAPGALDLEAGVILQAFNLPDWTNFPIRQSIGERFDCPVHLQNDANAAAFGEFWAGAGRGVRSLMLWSLGTGVGSGIILDGKVLSGAHGHAGECGQMVVQMDGGPASEHGLHGSIELYAGARALVRRAHEFLAQGTPSSLAEVDASGELTPLDIATAAERGDAMALRLISETARVLGVGTVNVIHTLNPDRILIGGAMTFGGESSPVGRQFLEEIRQTVRRMALRVPAERTEIEFAALGNDAGFIGAAGCLRQSLLAAE